MKKLFASLLLAAAIVPAWAAVQTVFSEDGTNDQRVARVEKSLDGDLESWITECDEHMAFRRAFSMPG
jgi:hypothetical protein